jgi:phage shock protein PspC (stress-responsive transcriptional regulator)
MPAMRAPRFPRLHLPAPRRPERETVVRAYAWLAVLVGCLLLAETLPRVHTALEQHFPYDGVTDWLGARAFLDGIDPYSPDGLQKLGLRQYGHPPTTSFWFLPFAGLDLGQMHAVVGYLTLLILLFFLLVLVREMEVPAPLATTWLAFALLLRCDWVMNHLEIAQISLFIAFAYLLAWTLARRGRDITAGVMLGLACTFKLFPGLVVLFFLVSRRWRVVLAAVAAYLVVALVMTGGYGLAAWPEFFAQQPAIADKWMDNIQNASIHGIVLRCFRPACTGRGPVLPVAMLISSGVVLGLFGLFFWLARRARRQIEDFDLAFALFTVLSVFASQWVWEHYYVTLLLPIAVAASSLGRAIRAGMDQRAGALGVLALAAIVVMLSIDRLLKIKLQHALAHDPSVHLRMHLYEAMNWLPTVLLLVLLALLLWRRRAQDETGADATAGAS